MATGTSVRRARADENEKKPASRDLRKHWKSIGYRHFPEAGARGRRKSMKTFRRRAILENG